MAHARKRFGQHFLADSMAIGSLLREINLSVGDRILEIGPGRGAISRHLMQLEDVDISGNAKLKINKIVNGEIPELSKPNFQKMFIEDRMFGALPNMDSWIMQTWTKLNRFAKINNGKKA